MANLGAASDLEIGDSGSYVCRLSSVLGENLQARGKGRRATGVELQSRQRVAPESLEGGSQLGRAEYPSRGGTTGSRSEGELVSSAQLDRLQESDNPVREIVKGWKAPRKIVVRVDTPERIAWLQAAAPNVKLIPITRESGRGSDILPLIGDADAVVGLCNEQIVKAGKINPSYISQILRLMLLGPATWEPSSTGGGSQI